VSRCRDVAAALAQLLEFEVVKRIIAPIVRDAVRDLQAGLAVYWPSGGENEMPEAHALGAIGRALGRAGFHVFHEVQCPSKDTVGHVDLLAISMRRSACIAVEGKRLYDGRGCDAMLADWKRLGTGHLACDWKVPQAKRHFRMMVTTTWQDNIREWWTGTSEVPVRRRHPSWKALRAETAGAFLGGTYVQTRDGWGDQWLLFAFGERERSFFQ
jgi:hypothetical protein